MLERDPGVAEPVVPVQDMAVRQNLEDQKIFPCIQQSSRSERAEQLVVEFISWQTDVFPAKPWDMAGVAPGPGKTS